MDELKLDDLMSCPCGRGDYELCAQCPYPGCSVHGDPTQPIAVRFRLFSPGGAEEDVRVMPVTAAVTEAAASAGITVRRYLINEVQAQLRREREASDGGQP